MSVTGGTELQYYAHEIYSNDDETRFVDLAWIGQGTYGTVFRARDRNTNQLVAIKRAEHTRTRGDTQDQGIPVTLLREIALLKKLQHQHIVSLHEVIVRPLAMFLVLELCACNLRNHIHELEDSGVATMDNKKLKSIAYQVLSAVAYCHDLNIMHRDMKPDNILLDETRSVVKVADFGMARLVDRRSGAYTDNCVTEYYRPPEIILGDKNYAKHLHSVDMWSFGCILVEMVNLRPAFGYETELQRILKIFEVVGTPAHNNWPEGMTLEHFHVSLLPYPAQTADVLLQAAGTCPHIVNLICRTLILDPSRRMTAVEALGHAAFHELQPSAAGPLQDGEQTVCDGAVEGSRN